MLGTVNHFIGYLYLLTFQFLFISWGGIYDLEGSYYSLDSYSPFLILFIEGGTLKEVIILIPGRDITWKLLFYGCG
uniref:Uncharacterized protein n=1 Tax=Picea glauca TaxID=3330 RepID=A0A101M2G2_PICGL|nr:hypothetical protein ABT39_MTgene2935 [Picea glauca]